MLVNCAYCMHKESTWGDWVGGTISCVRDRGPKAFLLIGREKRKRTVKDVDRMSSEGADTTK